MKWLSRSNLYSATILLGFIFCLGLTLAHGWHDEDGILRWNPTWFPSFKYSAPIGIRSRGYLFKRVSLFISTFPYIPMLQLTSDYPYGLKWSPNFLLGPFGSQRDTTEPVQREYIAPRNRKVLGWYNGPGSSYQMMSKAQSSEEDDDYSD